MKLQRTKLVVVLCFLTVTTTATADELVYVGKTAPYTDAALVAKHIIDECGLPESQMKVLHGQAKELGATIVADVEAVAANKGRLLENGEELGSFTGIRGSMGGMWAGYKSSCSLLYRCQTTLAKDIIGWLKNPTQDARIGE